MEKHLRGCAECRAELDVWRETAGLLAYTVTPIEPSSQLRNLIIERVRRDGGPATATNVVPLRRKPAPNWLFKFEAVAAALIFLVLMAGLLLLWRENRAARTEIARLSAQIDATQNQLNQEHEILATLTRPGVRQSELAGTKDAPAAHATLAFDTKTGRAVLLAQGLPEAPPGKAYQLWFIVGARPLPGKVFKTDASGNAVLRDQIPPDALSSATFAITLEAQEGASTPTLPIYLLSQHS